MFRRCDHFARVLFNLFNARRAIAAGAYAPRAGLSTRADAGLSRAQSDCRVSAAPSARSQSRNANIFGSAEVALGHTIQYVFLRGRAARDSRTQRPLLRCAPARAVP